MTGLAPERQADLAASIAALPPPTTTAGPLRRGAFPRFTSFREHGRRDDPALIVAGNTQSATLRCASGQEDGAVAIVLEAAEGEVATHRGVQLQLNAEPGNAVDLRAEGRPAAGAYSGMPIAIMPPGTGIASKTVTG